jgi:uncharacterized protein
MDISDHPEGLVLSVRVQPGAKRSAIVGKHARGLKIAVAAPPVDDKANEVLVDFLRTALGLKRSQVEIIRGEKSRQKHVLLRGVNRDDVAKLMQ